MPREQREATTQPVAVARAGALAQGEDPPRLTHRVHIEEECVLVLAGVEAFNSIHQGWVSIVEVRMGNEQWCIWMRSKTASAHPNPSETFC